MIKINIKDNLHNALTLNEIKWIPCTAFSAVPITKIIKELNLSFPQGHDNPEQMAKIASIGYEYAGLEGLTLPFDLCFEAEAMGCTVSLKKGDYITNIIESPFKELNEIESPDDFINNARFPILEKAINILHEEYDDKEIPIIGSMIGPFTLLSQVFSSNIEGILKHVNNNIVDVEDALYDLNTGLLDEIDFYNELNVDVIAIYEPNATPKLLEPSKFKQILKPFLEELSQNIDCPSILHICGDTTTTLNNMMSCGFEGISIDHTVNVTEAKQLQAELNTPTRICGNISTEETLFRKRPKEVFNESIETLSKGIDILSPSCMISPNTPLRNVKAMLDARNKFCDI